MKQSIISIKANKGYTLISMLFAFLIMTQGIVLLSYSLQQLSYIQQERYLLNHEIGIDQIRILLASSYHIQLNHESLQFDYQGDRYTLLCEKDRVVRKPGYLIYISHINDAFFLHENKCIYLVYGHPEKKELLYVQK